jgi:geranylgeranyl diphosphate synthase type I
MIRYHFGYDSLEKTKSGKRLRPQILLRTALEEGGSVECAIDAAVAIEILHNYSLIHDDIEDGDELRHGRTTTWARYGLAHGINAGDALCAISYLTLLHEEALVPNRVVEMLHVLHEANLRMCEGQGLDISFETNSSVTMPQYLEMIAGKTGALFSASCQLGALAAGCDSERADAYACATTSRSVEGGVIDVIAALDRLGARDAADDAHDRALDDADRLASDASIDVNRTIRDFLAQGARRVA